MVSVVHISVLLGRNLQTDLDALDRMVVDSLVGNGDNALGGSDEGNDESMVEEIESQVGVGWEDKLTIQKIKLVIILHMLSPGDIKQLCLCLIRYVIRMKIMSESVNCCFSFHAQRRRT